MRGRDQATGAALGLVFGFMLAWSGMASPAVIREALLFEDSYLFLFMASAVATATIGSHLARRLRSRAVLRDEPIAWSRPRPERRHVTGALLFGVGWGVANVCPGPAAVQVGQGLGWGALTLTGILLGVWLHQRAGAPESEPASELAAGREPARVAQAAVSA